MGLPCTQLSHLRCDLPSWSTQVTDSINKLEAMGILTVSHDEKGTTLLTVLPLDEAADKAHIRNFDERREVSAKVIHSQPVSQ
jgi:hypothetical protein